MGFADTLFGGTKQTSILTKGQRNLLNQQSGLQQQYNPQTYGLLNSLGANPTDNYSYESQQAAGQAFNTGIVNPALKQLNQQIAGTQHSSNLHSSANRYAQDQLRGKTMDNLANLNYQNVLNQQKMEQEAGESASQRQLASLNALLGGNQTVLGTQGTALQKKAGLLDMINAGAGTIKGIGSLFS